jgi:hypothetical protein
MIYPSKLPLNKAPNKGGKKEQREKVQAKKEKAKGGLKQRGKYLVKVGFKTGSIVGSRLFQMLDLICGFCELWAHLGFLSWWRSLKVCNTEKQKESCVCRISKDFCFLFKIFGEIGR